MRMTAKWAGAAILIGAVLRVMFLGAKSLWFDEASTLLLAGQPLAGLMRILTSNEVNPPFYYALMHFWLKAFSDPRLGLRLFSALCAIGSLFAFRALAERLLPERARLPALWLAVCSSFWIHIAQDGRAYSLLLLVSLLSTIATLELSEEKPRPFLFPAYAGLAALGLYTHYYYAILLAGHAVWLGRTIKNRLGGLLMHAAAALMFAPWLRTLAAQMRTHTGEAVVGEPLTFLRVLDLLGTPFFDITFLGLALPAWTGVAVGAGFAALAASAALDARRAPARSAERRAADFGLTHLAAALAVVTAVELWSGRPVTQARYFTPLSPFLLLLAALGARRNWTRAVAGVVVAAGCAGYFFSAVMVDPRLDALAADSPFLRCDRPRRPSRQILLPAAARLLSSGAPPPARGVRGGGHGLPRHAAVLRRHRGQGPAGPGPVHRGRSKPHLVPRARQPRHRRPALGAPKGVRLIVSRITFSGLLGKL